MLSYKLTFRLRDGNEVEAETSIAIYADDDRTAKVISDAILLPKGANCIALTADPQVRIFASSEQPDPRSMLIPA